MKLIFLFLVISIFGMGNSCFLNESIPIYKPADVIKMINIDFIVIAHRGASAYYPENTMSAFRAAVDMKADMIELDVLLSKDKIPVVFHDEKLNKKSNGKGNLSDFTLSELKELDAGSWFSSKFKDERIPTLEEVLLFTKNKIAVNIEIKKEAVSENSDGAVVDLVLALIRKLDVEDEVIISSFDYGVVDRVKSKKPEIKAALLYDKSRSDKRDPVELVRYYKADAFNFVATKLSDKWVNQLNENNIPFFIYTVNNPKKMRSIIAQGAKGIFTNRPDVLNKVVSGLDLK